MQARVSCILQAPIALTGNQFFKGCVSQEFAQESDNIPKADCYFLRIYISKTCCYAAYIMKGETGIHRDAAGKSGITLVCTVAVNGYVFYQSLNVFKNSSCHLDMLVL